MEKHLIILADPEGNRETIADADSAEQAETLAAVWQLCVPFWVSVEKQETE